MKSKQSKLKTYCVHVSMEDTKVENILARTPQEAARKAEQQYLPTVEVMRTCSCGLDNEIDNSKCQDCGNKL